MSVATVKAALADIQHDVVKLTAYAEGPTALPHAPAMVNFTGPAQYDFSQSDALEVTRRYTMRLYLREVGQGIDGEAERLAEPWFAAVANCFAARRRLEQTQYVKTSRLISDSGLQVSEYAGRQYLAIDFVLEVKEWSTVNYLE